MKLPLLYKDRRLDGETALRQTQLIELHLLEVFKEICNRHDIKFWLCGGTLLGAMRHQGFIPWDDDLDVMMLKKDYRRFVRICRNELPDDVFLDLPQDDEAHRSENRIARLRDNYSTAIIRHDKRVLLNDHQGVNIDIFCLEECGSKNSFVIKVLHSLVSTHGYARRASYDKVSVCNLFKKWYLYGHVFLMWTIWRIVQLVSLKKPYLSPTNFYVAWKEWHPRDWFLRDGQPVRTTLFEGVEMPIPFETEKYLELLYHDWHRLPPEEKRNGYYGVLLPYTPCMHPKAMRYPFRDKAIVSCGGTLVDNQRRGVHE